MAKELAKVYDPKQVEDKIYDMWMEGGYFHSVPDKSKKAFTIVMPPPNITGQLHMGHALDNTLQDILTRWKRMDGYCALWIPGTDHASIATEVKIVESMKAEGLTKDDLGRDGFLDRAWKWKAKYGGRITEQLKKIGSSCDWDRERFTMDEGCSDAVKEVFIRLYEKGLIYRGERIINWCPDCKTSISDAEVEYEEQDGYFWHLRYPFADGSGYVELATTRPETMFGDTAVAVHPDDERYKNLIGKNVILPLVGKEIPIVADEYVEMDFGTGVVKITPAHDPNDFEVGLRHNLPVINIMNDDGTINDLGGKYSGMDRYKAREAVVKDLKDGGYLVKIEEHKHNVGTCYRCSTTVEPRASLQWFVKMEPLAKPAIEAVRDGRTEFVPERFDKTYFHWMENIKDWCISRQLWWGHRIPAFYCEDCGEVIVTRDESVDTCPKCGSHKIAQDPDTLDTWFSSALWPFSTLGWPKNTEELKYYYPTDVLVTGYDIIFFWVARMMFSGIEYMGDVPFSKVFIHGMVRDSQGRKMSKSLGNGIDPIEIIDAYGADALRLTLAIGNTPGNDMRYSEEKMTSSRNFANKLWNAARFILMNIPEGEETTGLPKNLRIEDKWLVSQLNSLAKEVNENLEKYELGLAVSKLYSFIWDVLCDWYIEIVKARLQDESERADASRVLVYVMSETLKLLHPFMPFITEEIWQALPHDGDVLMTCEYPHYKQELSFDREQEDFDKVVALIKGIRNVRSEMNVPPSKKANVYVETEYEDVFNMAIPYICRLGWASNVTVGKSFDMPKAVKVITNFARGFMPMDDLIDREKELARLNKERATCEKDITIINSKLNNEGFLAKAPPELVEAEREKLIKANEKLLKVGQSITELCK